ncbi:hypothetical protein FRC08_016571 [Ceratobasidium sp. 394]|nr:hypothetical protein FRC08_016571 [Ceratobasidium sp. 394]
MLVLRPALAATWLLRFWTSTNYNDEPIRPPPTLGASSSLWGGMSRYDVHPPHPLPYYACLFINCANVEEARNDIGLPAYGQSRLEGHIRTVFSALGKASSALHHHASLVRDVGRSSVLDECDQWRPCSVLKEHIGAAFTALSITLSSTLDRYPTISSSVDKSVQLVKIIRPTVYETSCIQWQPNSELQKGARLVSTHLSHIFGGHPTISSAISKYASILDGYAVRAHDAVCCALRPQPVPLVGFIRDNMSVPSALGSCGRGTESLYRPVSLVGFLRNNMSVPSTLGSCGRGTELLCPMSPRATPIPGFWEVVSAHDVVCWGLRPRPVSLTGFLRENMSMPSTLGSCGRGTELLHPMSPRATPIPVFWKVVSAPRVVIICCCLVLLALTTLRGCAKQLYLDAGIYLSPTRGAHTTALKGNRPLPSYAPGRPSPTRNIGGQAEPAGVPIKQVKRKWVRRID